MQPERPADGAPRAEQRPTLELLKSRDRGDYRTSRDHRQFGHIQNIRPVVFPRVLIRAKSFASR